MGLAGKCVDVSNGATADGTKIQLYTCNGTASQTWTRNGQTWRALGKCLDIAGGGTRRRHHDPAVDLQRHRRAELGAGAEQTPCVNPQSGKCLDVSGNNSADGTSVHLWTCAGAANQKWTLP